MKKKFKSSAISRFASFSKTAIAGGHLAIDRVEKVIKSHKKRGYELKAKIAAREIIKQMSHLKGALMKLGQMISITGFVYPEFQSF